MKKKLLWLLAILISPALTAQNTVPVGVVAFYNIENLFDTENDSSINDEEFLPEGRNEWTAERYQQKLHNIARVLSNIQPDILGLCEIENRKVIEDLIAQPELAKNRYQIVHFDSPDKRGVDVALVYRMGRFIPFFTKAIPMTLPDEPNFTTRDILYVKGLFQKDSLHVFVNHWPSRRGGKEDGRIRAAQVLRGQVDSILAINPSAKIVMMGDFNDDPANQSIKTHLNAPTKTKGLEPGELYNASAETFKQGYGSLGFNGIMNLFDQIIISQGLLDSQSQTFFYIDDSYKIFSPAWMQVQEGKDKGYPMRSFARGVYNPEGFSDHYPVFLLLGIKKQ